MRIQVFNSTSLVQAGYTRTAKEKHKPDKLPEHRLTMHSQTASVNDVKGVYQGFARGKFTFDVAGTKPGANQRLRELIGEVSTGDREEANSILNKAKVLQGLRLLREAEILDDIVELTLPDKMGATELEIFNNIQSFPQSDNLNIDPELLSIEASQNGISGRGLNAEAVQNHQALVRQALNLFESAINEYNEQNSFQTKRILSLIDSIEQGFEEYNLPYKSAKDYCLEFAKFSVQAVEDTRDVASQKSAVVLSEEYFDDIIRKVRQQIKNSSTRTQKKLKELIEQIRLLQALKLLQHVGVLDKKFNLELVTGKNLPLFGENTEEFPTINNLTLDSEILSNKAYQSGLPEREISRNTAVDYCDAVRKAKGLFEAVVEDPSCLQPAPIKQSVIGILDKVKQALADS